MALPSRPVTTLSCTEESPIVGDLFSLISHHDGPQEAMNSLSPELQVSWCTWCLLLHHNLRLWPVTYQRNNH
ncbi:hypothetical protein GDO81_028021 [Engystomops pustulosus]|uniref:Uncharacterized protein n=1 Tax=Engystomops pustulosus TaxID=76066 RepID=A0AAV6YYN9_ENGPU|nr:hypothetical protein GDO81_028021 [Engystomops pustulosus]